MGNGVSQRAASVRPELSACGIKRSLLIFAAVIGEWSAVFRSSWKDPGRLLRHGHPTLVSGSHLIDPGFAAFR